VGARGWSGVAAKRLATGGRGADQVVHEKRPARTWLVRILVQLYPRVLGLPAAVLLVSAVRGGEGCDEHGVDQQVQKPMHARRRGARCWRPLFEALQKGATRS
jgi:hypothetical protein